MTADKNTDAQPDDFDEEEISSENFSKEPVEPDAIDREAKFPREIDASYDASEDLTDEEIDRILGKSSSRRIRIIVTSALVAALLCLWIFKWGGRERINRAFHADTIAVAGLADSLEARALDSLRQAADRYIIAQEGVVTIPAAKLPPELRPDTAALSAVLPDTAGRNLADFGMPFETVTPQSLQSIESTRIPTLGSITSPFSEKELTYNLPGPSMGEFEWMLHVDLAREELRDTLPDMADEDFYKLLYSQLADTDTTAIKTESEFNQLLLYSLDEVLPEAVAESVAAVEATRVIVHDTVVVIDPQVKAVNDSLAKTLTDLQRALDVAHRDISGMKLEIGNRDKQIIRQQDSIRAAEVRRFARIIEKMDPTEAVRLLEGRSTEELIELLFLLKQRDAAKIIEALPPDKGKEVTARIFYK